MYRIPQDFKNQSLKSHTMLTRFTVLDATSHVHTLEGVVDGSVRSSVGDAIRRDFRTTIMVTSDFTIEEADDLLQPAGTEVRPEVGFEIDDEDVYIPQGVYEIEGYSSSETNDGILVTIRGYDRAFTAQKPALKPYSVRGGTNGALALEALINSMVPRATFEGDTPWTAPSLFFPADTDRWAEAQKLALSFGTEIGFDLDGNAAMVDIEDTYLMDPVWSFIEGEEGCTFTEISKDVRTDHVRTGVIVIGTHSSLRTEVRGEAWDMRPNSPTYRYGPIGERPLRVYSELPTTTGQAQAMAMKMLSSALAGSDMVRFTCPIMPALDLGDVVDIIWPRCRINGRYMVQSIDMPLDGGPMQVDATRGSLVWSQYSGIGGV